MLRNDMKQELFCSSSRVSWSLNSWISEIPLSVVSLITLNFFAMFRAAVKSLFWCHISGSLLWKPQFTFLLLAFRNSFLNFLVLYYFLGVKMSHSYVDWDHATTSVVSLSNQKCLVFFNSHDLQCILMSDVEKLLNILREFFFSPNLRCRSLRLIYFNSLPSMKIFLQFFLMFECCFSSGWNASFLPKWLNDFYSF